MRKWIHLRAARVTSVTWLSAVLLRIALAGIGAVITRAGEAPMAMQPAAPAPSRAHEPLLEQFSASKAAEYLDKGAHALEKNCFACHSSYAYLLAAPVIAPRSPVHRQTRTALEQSVAALPAIEPSPQNAPDMRAVAAVMTAAVLAQHDAATTGRLHPLTRTALDRMWEFQQPDGGWKWAKLSAPPSEIDEHFGVTMAAIAVGAAPEKYALTPKAQEGLNRIRAYLRDHPPRTMHNRAMLMLAANRVDALMTDEQRRQTAADLFVLQRPDGGWAMAGLGDWQRPDGQAQHRLRDLRAACREWHSRRRSAGTQGRDLDEGPPACQRMLVHPLAA
jgi:squalene-hopene/tetraprenyl-beta-curcumene cyclase